MKSNIKNIINILLITMLLILTIIIFGYKYKKLSNLEIYVYIIYVLVYFCLIVLYFTK